MKFNVPMAFGYFMQLLEWIRRTKPWLEDRKTDGTTQDARRKLAAFQDYSANQNSKAVEGSTEGKAWGNLQHTANEASTQQQTRLHADRGENGFRKNLSLFSIFFIKLCNLSPRWNMVLYKFLLVFVFSWGHIVKNS